MARRLRIQFPGARYHVINRGNLQYDIFATDGARRAFIGVMGEACEKFAWRVHAYTVMRNHYHLGLETPEPNLVDGMHWLQSTFAIRLTRFHDQHGHVFQGRYQSLLIQDDAHLARVCDYIHLNPVRAGVVSAVRLPEFAWSSLSAWLAGSAHRWLESAVVLRTPGGVDAGNPWMPYVMDLVAVANGDPNDDRMVRGAFSRGWAIGTAGWRKALAREHAHLAVAPELSQSEVKELQSERWQRALDSALQECGRSQDDLAQSPKSASWKRALALKLRDMAAPPFRWLADKLCMGEPGSVRAYVWSEARQAKKIAQSTAPTASES